MATAQPSSRTSRTSASRSSTPAGSAARTATTGAARTPARKTASSRTGRGRTSGGTQAATSARGGRSREPEAGSKAVPFTDVSAMVRRTEVTVPVVHMRIPMLSPRVPSAGAIEAQARWMAQAVRANLPSAERMLYYGGLGALAVVGALEWPVAAAVGAGVWVAGRTTGRRGGKAPAA